VRDVATVLEITVYSGIKRFLASNFVLGGLVVQKKSICFICTLRFDFISRF
jgi:hypothetical protein